MFSRQKKLSFQKVKKFDIFQRGQLVHGFFQKIAFSTFVFFRKIRQKSLLRIFLDRRECFLDKKNKVLKKSKNSTFFKGVSPWFLSKKGNFQLLFFFQTNKPKKSFAHYSGQKRMFSREQKLSFKKVQKLEIFLRG